MPNVKQPVTDDSIKVRQLTHYQFSWVAGEPGKPGTYTLQLVLDQGAWKRSLPSTQTTRVLRPHSRGTLPDVGCCQSFDTHASLHRLFRHRQAGRSAAAR